MGRAPSGAAGRLVVHPGSLAPGRRSEDLSRTRKPACGTSRNLWARQRGASHKSAGCSRFFLHYSSIIPLFFVYFWLTHASRCAQVFRTEIPSTAGARTSLTVLGRSQVRALRCLPWVPFCAFHFSCFRASLRVSTSWAEPLHSHQSVARPPVRAAPPSLFRPSRYTPEFRPCSMLSSNPGPSRSALPSSRTHHD